MVKVNGEVIIRISETTKKYLRIILKLSLKALKIKVDVMKAFQFCKTSK